MTSNRIKLRRPVTIMKYLATVVSLIFLPKTLIWNKIVCPLPASNSINFAELVENELMKRITKKNYPCSFFCSIYG